MHESNRFRACELAVSRGILARALPDLLRGRAPRLGVTRSGRTRSLAACDLASAARAAGRAWCRAVREGRTHAATDRGRPAVARFLCGLPVVVARSTRCR